MTLDAINAFVEKNGGKYERLSRYIWENPELAYNERKSSQALIKHLKDEGYKVTENAAGIETAFVGEFGEEGPIIGFLGEYDALPGLSQVGGAAAEEELVEGGNGHGCGHNLLGVGSLIAADIFKKQIEEKGLKARVKFFGCPAEEGGSGKTFMAREGLFDDLDMAFCWHPMDTYEVWNQSSMANIQLYYKFHGKASHAASAPELGRSALDAVELTNVGVQFLREHMPDDTRVHYAITDTGGNSPNVVQPYAEVLYLIRAKDIKTVKELRARVDKIAQGAAMMTETELEIDFIKACSNFVNNETIEAELYESMQAVELPEVSSEDQALIDEIHDQVKDVDDNFMAKINQAVDDPVEREKYYSYADDSLYNFVLPYKASDGLLMGSTDVGDVSWNCPTGQILTASWPAKVAPHTWPVTAMGVTDHAFNTMKYTGKVLGLTAIRFAENPELMAQAKKDFKRKLNGQSYESPIPAGVQPRSIS